MIVFFLTNKYIQFNIIKRLKTTSECFKIANNLSLSLSPVHFLLIDKYIDHNIHHYNHIHTASTSPDLTAFGIRVEFHVAWLGHALPCVHLLDASPQVVPYLVEAYLFQSVGVLGPVWRHRRGPVLAAPLPTEQYPPFLLRWAFTPRLLSSVVFCPDSASGSWFVGCEAGCSPTLHAWVALSATPPPKSFSAPHQMTCEGNEAKTQKYILINE